jgi:hypothetical protein
MVSGTSIDLRRCSSSTDPPPHVPKFVTSALLALEYQRLRAVKKCDGLESNVAYRRVAPSLYYLTRIRYRCMICENVQYIT